MIDDLNSVSQALVNKIQALVPKSIRRYIFLNKKDSLFVKLPNIKAVSSFSLVRTLSPKQMARLSMCYRGTLFYLVFVL